MKKICAAFFLLDFQKCLQLPLSSFFSWSKAHEYISVDGNVGTVGITDFAQAALGDIVFVDVPEAGDEFEKGDSFGSVESVKAASDIYSPVSGTITEVNDPLADDLSSITADNAKQSWLFKIRLNNAGELDSLMDEAAYNELIAD